MFSPDGSIRGPYRALHEAIAPTAAADFNVRSEALDRAYVDQGITFSLSGQERPFPLDIVPRVISASEWNKLARASCSGCGRYDPTNETTRRSGTGTCGSPWAATTPTSGRSTGPTAGRPPVPCASMSPCGKRPRASNRFRWPPGGGRNPHFQGFMPLP